MPEVTNVGKYTVALGEGTPKHGEKNALSPIYRCAAAQIWQTILARCEWHARASITPHDI